MDDIVDVYLGNANTKIPFVPYNKPHQPSRDEVRWYAANNDVSGLTTLLKRYPKAANQLAPFMISPLHEACRVGNHRMVDLLVGKGAHVNAR